VLRDAREVAGSAELHADLCIVGAGPAGLVLARELVGIDRTVILLESGGSDTEPAAQELNRGDVNGIAYSGLDQTRHRQIGGTTNTWNTPLRTLMGAKYVPLDPWDFEPRSGPGPSGWPFDGAALRTYYRRAQGVCGLGAFDYTGERTGGSASALPLPSPILSPAIYQFGPAALFTQTYPEQLAASNNVTLLHQGTACGLRIDSNARTATGIDVATLSGTRFRIRARLFVLAAGAVENARLLLLSREPGRDAPGNAGGWVGRCFMEHPRDRSLRLIPAGPEVYRQAAFYDRHEWDNGVTTAGRMAFDPRIGERSELPNASITLLPLPRDSAPGARLLKRVARRLGAPRLAATAPRGYGWSTTDCPDRHYRGFQLLLNLEQFPHPENRIVLGAKPDRLGLQRAALHWQWRAPDQSRLDRLRETIAEAFRATELGRIEMDRNARPDLSAHHHAGTVRMHDTPRQGAVDADTRVHGMDNLYVTGSAVFPTAGYANPTLTIVALALRLADHLKNRL
jgi:choline dehydrogenase-like flavoprotein